MGRNLDWLCDGGGESAALPLDGPQVLRTAAGEVSMQRHAFKSGLRLYDTRIRTHRGLVLHPQVPHDSPFISANVALSGSTTARFSDGVAANTSVTHGSLFRPRSNDSEFRVDGKQTLRLVGVAADLPVLARWFGPRIPRNCGPTCTTGCPRAAAWSCRCRRHRPQPRGCSIRPIAANCRR